MITPLLVIAVFWFGGFVSKALNVFHILQAQGFWQSLGKVNRTTKVWAMLMILRDCAAWFLPMYGAE